MSESPSPEAIRQRVEAQRKAAGPWQEGRTLWPLVAVFDLLSVCALVLFGHAVGNDGGVPLLLGTLPFLAALLIAWVVSQWRWQPLQVLKPGGLAVWASTAGVALGLRAALFSQPPSGDFIAMTVILLGTFMLGWRVLYRYARAHDYLVPPRIQRMLDGQGE